MTSDRYVPGSGNEGYLVTHYDLELDYRLSSNRLAGRAGLSVTATRPLSALTLDVADLRVAKVWVDGRRAARYAHRAGKLQIWFAGPVAEGASLTIDVQYSGNPKPRRGPWGEVGWEELTDGVIVASQPNGAPSWFPCNDHPSNKASYRISMTADSPYQVLANGALVGKRVHGSRTTWVYEQAEPMATYLATVQIGQYAVYDLAPAPVRQRAAVPPRLRRAFEGDFGRQPEMMVVFERLFGPYPFTDYTVVVVDDELEIPLEAQGLSIFGSNHVDARRGAERLVAHELAHQWFGNSLTLGRWQDIWLHEGFACYAEWLWSQESGADSCDALARRAWHRLRGLRQDLVLADPGPELMFDDRVYKRGALTLHAVRLTLGDDAFFAMLHRWTTANRHGTVTTAAFVECAGGLAKTRMGRLLTAWLHDPTLPQLPSR